MIARVYGAVNGVDVVYALNRSTGLWETTIPETDDGTYVASLYAEDEAGNSAYLATVLYTFNMSGMCVDIRVIDYNERLRHELFNIFGMPAEFTASAAAASYSGYPVYNSYDLSVIRCERCGEIY